VEVPGHNNEARKSKSNRDIFRLGSCLYRGVESYADEVVKIGKVFGSLLGNNTTIAHSIFVPLGGVCSSGLIRMMLDIDSWLQSGDIRSPYSLSRSCDFLWQALLGSPGDTDLTSTGERIYFLPENMHSPKKIHFVSSALKSALPCSISRISSDLEQKIIGLYRGVESYADEVVKIGKVLGSLLGNNTTIAHSIFVPLGGV
jgi:hypothetical protein